MLTISQKHVYCGGHGNQIYKSMSLDSYLRPSSSFSIKADKSVCCMTTHLCAGKIAALASDDVHLIYDERAEIIDSFLTL
jgi:hypothetical protein